MTQVRASYALIVDDHPLSLKGLKHFMEELAVVGRVVPAEGPADIDRVIAEFGSPRLAMVDFWLADGTATVTMRHLQKVAPAARLIVVSGDDRPAVASRAKALGAHGFIRKRDSPRDYRNAVLAVLAGRCWFDGESPLSFDDEASSLANGVSDSGRDLTPRQQEVLELVLQGRPNKLIAQLLALSEYTVKEHVTSILRKLGASNRIELIMRLHAERRRRGQGQGGGPGAGPGHGRRHEAQEWSTTV